MSSETVTLASQDSRTTPPATRDSDSKTNPQKDNITTTQPLNILSDLEKGQESHPASPPKEHLTYDTENPHQPQTDTAHPTSNKEAPDANIIDFTGPTDKLHPQNWPFGRKCAATCILAGMTFTTTFTSSIFSTAIPATSTEFHTSTEIMTLGTSLFLLGFTLGPIIWGPLSELYGRRVPLLVGVGAMGCFQVGVATAQNLWTVFVCRFLGGVFGVAPLCVVGGALGDFWDPVQRGVTVGVYSMCTFIGPVAAPILGGFVAESWLGWRWTEYVSVIMAGLFWSIALVLLPESSHPRILHFRAKKLRMETGNWALHAKADEKEITVTIVVERYFTRPFRMLWQEPILCCIALYTGLTYGILYLFLTAYPISFHEQRHWKVGPSNLPFLSITLGVILGGLFNTYYTLTTYRRTTSPSPETRLPPLILGGVLLPPGLFLFGWTSSPALTPWLQIIAGVPMGAGILLILVNGLNYTVDVYQVNANSAIAANTMVRCVFGAAFPMFAERMYGGLGVEWASSVLGVAAAGCAVFAVGLWRWGRRIRGRSRFVLEG